MTRIKAANDQPRALPGLSEIVHLYDGFILDLWGVVHDGIKPFPWTRDTLTELKRARRIVWLLSNAPRRRHLVADRLTQMGIGPELYDGIMTSGEAAWMAMKSQYLAKWGKKCFHLGPAEKDGSLYEGLDIEILDKPEGADFVLATGVYDFADTAEQYTNILSRCRKANLPMICANPDRIVHVADQLVVCAGTFADMYREQEGEVVYFGKPHRAVYTLCLEGMGVQTVLAVGDGMQTDIEGAASAGIDSALVTSGIHRDAFPGEAGAARDYSAAGAFLARYPFRPTYLISDLLW